MYPLQTFAQPESPRIALSAWGRKNSKTHKNDLLKYHPDEIGEQLCLHEQGLYLKIRPRECLNWGKTQSGKSAANLILFCATHEKLGAWVKMSILNTEVLGKRADVVDYWIKVAEVSVGRWVAINKPTESVPEMPIPP
jgi:son of sevenless